MKFFREEQKIIPRYDILLVASVVLLTSLGLVVLYSASYLFALNQPHRFPDGLAPLRGNLLACILGLVGFFIASRMNLQWLQKKKSIMILVLVTVAFNLLPLVPIFQPITGQGNVNRWIYINAGGRTLITFQPSEMIKIILPIYLAYILNKNKDNFTSFSSAFLPSLFWMLLFSLLVIIQSNYSEAVFIALVSLGIWFITGIRFRHISMAILLLVFVAFLLFMSEAGERMTARILSFLNRDSFQVEASIAAVRSGGFLGQGIGQGSLKLRVPEVHGDFVFASFAEESGFLGVIFYFALISFFVWAGLREAWRSQIRFNQILAIALVLSIAVQFLMNIAVVVGIVPTTGIPLPFFSSGGSSLLMTLIGAGLIVNVSRQNYIAEKEGGRNVG